MALIIIISFCTPVINSTPGPFSIQIWSISPDPADVDETVTFKAAILSGVVSETLYKWTFGDGYSVQGYGKKTVYHSYDSDGTYTVKVEGWYNGQYDSDTDYITVINPELVVWTNGPWEANVGESIDFIGYATGGTLPYVEWKWHFINDDSSDEFWMYGQSFSKKFWVEDHYTVTLTVTDSDNNEDFDIEDLTIGEPPNYNIDIEVNVWPEKVPINWPVKLTTTVTYLDGNIECVGAVITRGIYLPNGEKQRLPDLYPQTLNLLNNKYKHTQWYTTFMNGDHLYQACVYAELDSDCGQDAFIVKG